jgi:hypothetical protein
MDSEARQSGAASKKGALLTGDLDFRRMVS